MSPTTLITPTPPATTVTPAIVVDCAAPIVTPLPAETFHIGPHVQPPTLIAGWVWTIFASSAVSLVGIIMFIGFTRTAAPLSWPLPTFPRQLSAAAHHP
jgi:hypothetical protein